MALAVGIALVLYVVAMMGIGWLAQRRVSDVEDYVLAGRRLGFGLATPTLLATWFGAGTLLIATDEVRAEGLKASALDPVGAGICLLLAGAFLAAPLWRMQLLTLADLFRRAYGPRAELLAALLMVPGYFGWIAAQFVALSELLELYLAIPVAWGLPLVALVGTAYTLVGGMWAVTLTDAVQMALIVVGLVVVLVVLLLDLGAGDPVGGAVRLWTETPPEKRSFLPPIEEVGPWVAALAAGALGNLPGQDLTQRLFAASSARTARAACLTAGVLYLSLGMIPLAIGLGADVLGASDSSILAVLAHTLLHPAMAVLLVVTVVSAVLSTIDSAILAPATVLAHNVARSDHLWTHRLSVAAVAACSLVVAWMGESAWSLLESSYEIGLVTLLVPMLAAVWWPGGTERAALAAMGTGTVLWVGHFAVGAEELLFTPIPLGLGAAAIAAAVFAGLRAPRFGT